MMRRCKVTDLSVATLRRCVPSMRVVKQLWLCLFLGLLFMRSTVFMYANSVNQFYMHWQRSDALGMLLSIAVVAVGLFVAYRLVSCCGRWGVCFGQLCFVSFAMFYLKVAFGETILLPPKVSLISKALVVAVVVLFFLKRQAVVRGVMMLCLLFSPILLFFGASILTGKSYQSVAITKTDLEPLVVSGRVTKVYIFLFDQLAYSHTFSGRKVLGAFPGIKRATENSIVFHRAYSPAPLTISSMMSMLFGVSGHAELTRDGINFRVGDKFRPASEYENAFEKMQSRGYRTAMYSHYLPWPEIITRGFHELYSESTYKLFGDGPLNICGQMLLQCVAVRFGRIFPRIRGFNRAMHHKYFVELDRWTHAAAISEIKNKIPSCVLFHYPVPHMPYIFTRKGPVEDLSQPYTIGVSDYLGNVAYTDSLIDELLDVMEGSADYENTLFVITSDHAFQQHPAFANPDVSADEMCRVPLLIHLPGQTNRIDIDSPMPTSELMQILDQYLTSEMDFDETVTACSSYTSEDIKISCTEGEIESLRRRAKDGLGWFGH